MKRKFLIIFYFLVECFGIIRFFYWINRNKKIVLTYHNVIPDRLFDDSCHLGVSHRELIFEEQVKLIRRRNINCLVTFDDGYKNQLEVVSKILSRYGMQGFFFVSFQSVITGRALVIDKVMMWVSYVPAGCYVLLDEETIIDEVNRSSVASKLYGCLIKDPKLWNSIEQVLDQAFLFNSLVINPNLMRLRFEPFNLEDLEVLRKSGHIVGSHGWSHFPLGTLTPELQKEDFLICASFARQYCNSMLFSYPFGGTEEVLPLTAKLCEEHGFSAAYMNMPKSPTWPDVNKNYILPRMSLPNESNSYILDAKLSGFELFCKTWIF